MTTTKETTVELIAHHPADAKHDGKTFTVAGDPRWIIFGKVSRRKGPKGRSVQTREYIVIRRDVTEDFGVRKPTIAAVKAHIAKVGA